MTKPKVILREQADYNPALIAEKAAGIIEGLSLDARGRTVLLKPSFVYPSRDPIVRGIITQPQLIVGVAKALRDKGARRILICESSILGPSRLSFEAVGILPMIKGLAEPVYLDEMEEVEVEVKDPIVQRRFRVPKIWLDADLFISLPKIKTNLFSGLTLTIKNNLGMLRQYNRLLYHDYRLHKKLADLYKVRQPDMAIADCIVAGEGQGPLLADPVELGLMVGGNNAIAVDVVACHLVGYKPDEIEHLKLLIEAGYGPGSLAGIDIERSDLLSRARPFRRPSISLSDISPNMRIFQGTAQNCESGCPAMVHGMMDPYVSWNGKDGIRRMNVIFGKPIDSLPDDLDPAITLVLGDCAERHRNRGQFVPGCCPRPLDIGLILRRIQGPVKMEFSAADILAAFRAYSGHYLWRFNKILAGKHLEPIENHVTIPRMLWESAIEIYLRVAK